MTSLVIIPPLVGSNDLFVPFTRALAARGVLATLIEPPGVGDAPAPHGVPSTRALAHTIADRWERAPVLAISIGGMIAQWIAIDLPARVDRLILASTVPHGIEALLHARLRPLTMLRCLFGTPAQTTRCLVEGILTEAAEDDERMREIDAALRAHPRTRRDFAWLAAAAAAHDAREELRAVPHPTLVLSGSEDSLTPLSAQATLLELLPNAQQEIIAGAGHALFLDAPDKTADRVAAFLGDRPS